ncbi:MAG: beta-lactamase family protein [Gammaproteobacteria bacterium]|nr:beta-lactamase family protein [Gammaproteobacteria bacterium]
MSVRHCTARPCGAVRLVRRGRTPLAVQCVFCEPRTITAAAGWLLVQDGKLDTNDRVCDIVAEFGTHGKDIITVEQLFTHTAGFPHAPFKPTDWHDRKRRLERFGEWTLNWQPGSRFEYHPTSSMYVIAEIIERKSHVSFESFVKSRIIDALGIDDLYLGCPDAEHGRILNVEHVGDALTAKDYEALGIPAPPVTEVTEEALTNFNDAAVRRVPIPGGGAVASAAAMALFYQGLLDGGVSLAGRKIWRDDTMRDALRVRTDFPDYFGVPVNRALGVIVAGDERRNARGFGHSNSPQAFGHGGAGGQIAWADPATGISFAYCTNGHDRNPLRQGRRGVSLSNRAAICAMAED